tara:strand:- start:1682 stop:1783 length:102 start_codon:yes stop_codon:yes gene_type:complete
MNRYEKFFILSIPIVIIAFIIGATIYHIIKEIF